MFAARRNLNVVEAIRMAHGVEAIVVAARCWNLVGVDCALVNRELAEDFPCLLKTLNTHIAVAGLCGCLRTWGVATLHSMEI